MRKDDTALPAKKKRATLPTLVPWTGELPEGCAEYLGRQSEWDRRHLFAVVGRHKPVRDVIGIARRLHKILVDGPQRAASGYWSFEEYIAAREDLEHRIAELYRRVNETAVRARVIAARVSQANKKDSKKEAFHGDSTLPQAA